MLLDFRVSNYKSFKNEARLNLIPAPKQKDLEYSILKKTIDKNEYKALSTAVLYGPNAAGKTNIIGAIDTLINLVNRGNINNIDRSRSLNIASVRLEFIPNNMLNEVKPVNFSISFIKNNKYFEYSLSIILGTFLDSEAKRKVLSETLIVNGFIEFERNENTVFLSKENTYVKQVKELLTLNLSETELFISNGYKTMVNNTIFNEFVDYLNNDITVIYRADSINITNKSDSGQELVENKILTDVAKEIGSINNQIGFFHLEKDSNSEMVSFFKKGKETIAIPSDLIESYGTIRFLNLYPTIKKVLDTGGVLIIDEFDASIHPMVLLDIVNIFHNDEKNINRAQLIFNTHNPVFLNSSVLRRDEIKFVEKDDNGSTIYSLADFQTSGKSGVRKTDDYMKHYFINKYGAILDVDLSDLFEVKNEKTK